MCKRLSRVLKVLLRRCEAQRSTATLGDKPELQIDERDVTIKYTAIDYFAPSSIEFRYRLSGLDSDWRYANTRREAIYTNLPPGAFLFQLEAKRGGEDWQKGSSYRVHIRCSTSL